jgi:hypothetical protein
MLIPSNILVTNQFPKEEAPSHNLAYYIPTQEPVSTGTMRRILIEAQQARAPRFAGAALQSHHLSTLRLDPVNQRDRDILYELGYNPLIKYPGAGNVVWGQDLSQVKVSLDYLIKILDLMVQVQRVVAVYRTQLPDQFGYSAIFTEVQALLHGMTARQDFLNIDSPFTSNEMSMWFIAFYNFTIEFKLNLSCDKGGIFHWWSAIGKLAGDYMEGIVNLYPNICWRLRGCGAVKMYELMGICVEAY